jgi:hypothetical protein
MSLISGGSISPDSTFKEPRNRFQGIDFTRLCSLAGRYRYVKSGCRSDPPGWESIPGLLKRFANSGSEHTGTTKIYRYEATEKSTIGKRENKKLQQPKRNAKIAYQQNPSFLT